MKRTEKNNKIKQLYSSLTNTDTEASVLDICDTVGISKPTFYKWKNTLVDVDPKIKTKKTVKDYTPLRSDTAPPIDRYSNFIAIPTIREFENNCMINRKKPHLSHLFRICNGSNTHPDTLSTDINSAKLAFNEFDTLYRKDDPNITNERYRKVLRSFLQFRGISIPNKDPVIHGGSDSQGDYATVAMNPQEVELVAKFIGESKGEVYQDMFRIHHESFPRPQTLHSWIPNIEIKYADVDGESYPFGQSSVYERKQHKHYNKLILEPQALDAAVKYQGKRFIDLPFSEFLSEYAGVLREAYVEIGKISPDIVYPKGTDGWLWTNKPVYSIRHSAAVQWINRTSFDVNLVATMGWEKPDTLTKYYARISTNNIMEKGVCYYCSPPSVMSSQPLFCSAPHALAYTYGARRK